MIIDKYKTLEREQCSYPGSIGDSCAETSWLMHACAKLGRPTHELNLWVFMTDKGFVRHPTAPLLVEGKTWREGDFTSDQALPLYLAARSTPIQEGIATVMKDRIKGDGYRTGNGDFVSPIFFALLIDSKFLISCCAFVQVLLFKFPWRWSDSTKNFERSEDASADYINWFHASVYGYRWVRTLIPRETLKAKIRAYYKPEPNSEWLVRIYDIFIDHFWDRTL